MWWAGNSGADVYIGTRAAGVARGEDVVVLARVDGLAAALELVAAKLESQSRRLRLRVWLSGGLCQPFMLPPLDGISAEGERQKIALALASRQTTLGDDCQVWIDASSCSAASLAVAIGRSTTETLLSGLSRNGRVISVRPWWAEVLRAGLALRGPSLTTIGIQDCDSLTVLAGAGSKFENAGVITPMSDDTASRAAWTRALMAGDALMAGACYARMDLDRRAESPFGGLKFGVATSIDP